MDPSRSALSGFEPGDYFDDALANDAPSRERTYRVIGVRGKTVIAENTLGLRRSFTRAHEVARADRGLFDRMRSSSPPAAATPAAEKSEGARSDVA